MPEVMTFEDLKELLVHHGGVHPDHVVNNPNLSLESLGIGSMAMLAIQLDLSGRFGISLGEEDLPKLGTVGSFLEFVNKRGKWHGWGG